MYIPNRKTDDAEVQRVLRDIVHEGPFRRITKDWNVADFEYAFERLSTDTPKIFQKQVHELLRKIRDEREQSEIYAKTLAQMSATNVSAPSGQWSDSQKWVMGLVAAAVLGVGGYLFKKFTGETPPIARPAAPAAPSIAPRPDGMLGPDKKEPPSREYATFSFADYTQLNRDVTRTDIQKEADYRRYDGRFIIWIGSIMNILPKSTDSSVMVLVMPLDSKSENDRLGVTLKNPDVEMLAALKVGEKIEFEGRLRYAGAIGFFVEEAVIKRKL